MKPAPPLGMAYIAKVFESQNFDVKVIDCIAEDLNSYYDIGIEKDIVAQGLSFSAICERITPDTNIIGFSIMFTNNWLLDRLLINFIRLKFPNALLVAGGESISSMPEYALKDSSLDICIVGEGEDTTATLAEAVKKNEDWKSLEGIAYIENGQFVQNKRRERIRDLNQIEFPAWHFFPLDIYFKENVTWIPTQKLSLPILASRGCPYTCTFCSSPKMWTTKYNLRDPQNIIEEMDFLNKAYGVTNFELFDLTAIISRPWILSFCKLLQAHHVKYTWQMPAGTRSEALNDTVLTEMKKGGCTNVTFAPETGSAELIGIIGKKASPERMLSLMALSSKLDMYVFVNIMLGLPGETHKDVLKTIGYLYKAAKAGAHDIGGGMFMPYPGTALFDQLVAEKRILMNDKFLLDMVKIDSFLESKTYNDNISSTSYLFYNFLYLAVFYSTSFLCYPKRIIKLIRSLFNKKYTTRSEKGLGYLIDQLYARKQAVDLP